MAIRVELPLDNEGFIRRACPTCEREFKWLHTEDEDTTAKRDDRGFCCPYCAVWAQPDQWFTEAQLEHLQQAGLSAVAGEVDQIFSRFNRPGSALQYTPGDRRPKPAEMPSEVNDMERIDFACHSSEPIKVLDGWAEPVHCLVCGTSK